MQVLASLQFEATVVGIICIIFLLLFVVAGVRQMKQMQDDSRDD